MRAPAYCREGLFLPFLSRAVAAGDTAEALRIDGGHKSTREKSRRPHPCYGPDRQWAGEDEEFGSQLS